jgi:CO/xanthine dehydrogenase FAD-binding subunit
MISLDGDVIAEAAIALGGVGETVFRARQAELFLRGRPFQLSTLEEAGEVAASEISAIDDVRGSRDYRLQLTRNVLIKYFHDCVIPCQL